MLISLNWIREFVELPPNLSAKELADRFTIVCAEVEGVEAIEVDAKGLICAQIKLLSPVASADRKLQLTTLDVGGGKCVESVTAAPDLKVGDRVVYAPAGASVKSLGAISDSVVAGKKSAGFILPGEALGVAMAVREAIFLPPSVAPGAPLDSKLFDDWVIAIDNKSINHRPDLWGHYGMAREFAAIFGAKLKPYPVTPLAELQDGKLPTISIEIDDPDACPRYSGLLMSGVSSQPAPLWMQLRLGHVGLRPIDCLVDLTNYIMLELGQPMHAFDGDKVDRIEVCTAKEGQKFTTLDNIERTLPEGALVISSHRKPIALAGIMGGAETEISATTRSVLLESANFHPYVIRKCANHLGHRTDASARFEKSLDPAHTVLAIQRFVQLARVEFKEFAVKSRLSDAYPKPATPVTVTVDPEFVGRFMGHPVTRNQITQILTALEFKVTEAGKDMTIGVPSFRATRDISIEADIIEEVARYIGYNNIQPSFPNVVVRALQPNPLQRIERAALRLAVQGMGMTEIHGYIWYDAAWCRRLGYEPGEGLTLRNPAAAGSERLRQSLVPGMLAAIDLNRHHFSELRLVELGSAFPRIDGEAVERRCVGMMLAVRQKSAEDQKLAELKGLVETWALQLVSLPAAFAAQAIDASRPWEHPAKTAAVVIDGHNVGAVGVVPFELRQRIDEHLAAWSIVWAQITLDPLAAIGERVEKLPPISAHPEVELDFSVLVAATRRYEQLCESIRAFDHELLRRVTFVDSYEGKSVPAGRRALTFRARIASPARTLTDDDLVGFREAFSKHLSGGGMELRTA